MLNKVEMLKRTRRCSQELMRPTIDPVKGEFTTLVRTVTNMVLFLGTERIDTLTEPETAFSADQSQLSG